MLAGRRHPLGRFDVRSSPRPVLQPSDKRRADLSGQERVFAKVFLDPSPPQFA